MSHMPRQRRLFDCCVTELPAATKACAAVSQPWAEQPSTSIILSDNEFSLIYIYLLLLLPMNRKRFNYKVGLMYNRERMFQVALRYGFVPIFAHTINDCLHKPFDFPPHLSHNSSTLLSCSVGKVRWRRCSLGAWHGIRCAVTAMLLFYPLSWRPLSLSVKLLWAAALVS